MVQRHLPTQHPQVEIQVNVWKGDVMVRKPALVDEKMAPLLQIFNSVPYITTLYSCQYTREHTAYMVFQIATRTDLIPDELAAGTK